MSSKARTFVFLVALAHLGASGASAAPVDKFAAVKEALGQAAEGMRGGAESAKNSAEAPFQALRGAAFTPMEKSVVAGRCPWGSRWVCRRVCVDWDEKGRCRNWGSECFCE